MTSYPAVILLLSVGLVNAEVWIEYQKPQPGKAPFCVDKIEGNKRVGDTWRDPTECIQKRCLTDSQGTPLISYAGCGKMAVVGANCQLIVPEGNLTYPDCCPKPVCD